MDTKLCQTPLTGDYVAIYMREFLAPDAILNSIEAERIAFGQGYVSNILRLKLRWEPRSQDQLPHTVIVKVPTVESINKLFESISGQDEADKARGLVTRLVTFIHDVECEVYKIFKNKPPIAMPKYFAAVPIMDDAPGMIILEDLSSKASVAPSFVTGLTYHQVLAVVTELARLHAWSLTTTVDWKSKLPRFEDKEQIRKVVMAPLSSNVVETKEKYPNELGSIDVEKVAKYSSYESSLAAMNEHRKFIDDVIVHGDMHINNILFEKKSDGSVGDRLVAIIDFQVAMKYVPLQELKPTGCPAYDLARLFSRSVSQHLRREHYEDILRRYYDEVKSIAGDKFTATFDQIRYLTDLHFVSHVAYEISAISTMVLFMVKSQGEQREQDTKVILERFRDNYEDAVKFVA